MTAKGYPGPYNKGMVIYGLDLVRSRNGITVFHAGTRLEEEKVVCDGGRVLGITALAETLEGTIDNAYDAVAKIQWDGMHYRKDIGRRGE